MILMSSYSAASPRRTARTLSGGQPGWTTEFFGLPPAGGVSEPSSLSRPSRSGFDPQAFLVEQSPNSEVRPHFHLTDQFQVVVEGGGGNGQASYRCGFSSLRERTYRLRPHPCG
jgi:hypothetical protein